MEPAQSIQFTILVLLKGFTQPPVHRHSQLSQGNIPTHTIILLSILFLLLLCNSGYHCLEKTNASPVNLVDSLFFRTGKCTILQIVFYGNLQRSSLYKYLPIAHFICMSLDVCLYTHIYINLYMNTSSVL